MDKAAPHARVRAVSQERPDSPPRVPGGGGPRRPSPPETRRCRLAADQDGGTRKGARWPGCSPAEPLLERHGPRAVAEGQRTAPEMP